AASLAPLGIGRGRAEIQPLVVAQGLDLVDVRPRLGRQLGQRPLAFFFCSPPHRQCDAQQSRLLQEGSSVQVLVHDSCSERWGVSSGRLALYSQGTNATIASSGLLASATFGTLDGTTLTVRQTTFPSLP